MFHKVIMIGIAGMPGSGKSTVAGILQKIKKVRVINMGNLVREEVLRRGLSVIPRNLHKTADELRKTLGSNAVARLAMIKIDKIVGKEETVLIDGLRSIEEIEMLRKYVDLLIIAVHSPIETRYNRLKERKRQDGYANRKYFEFRDSKYLKRGIKDVFEVAEYKVVNSSDTSLGDLQDKVLNIYDEMVKTLRKKVA